MLRALDARVRVLPMKYLIGIVILVGALYGANRLFWYIALRRPNSMRRPDGPHINGVPCDEQGYRIGSDGRPENYREVTGWR